MFSSELLDGVDFLIIQHNENIKKLKAIRDRIILGEKLPEGLRPIREVKCGKSK